MTGRRVTVTGKRRVLGLLIVPRSCQMPGRGSQPGWWRLPRRSPAPALGPRAALADPRSGRPPPPGAPGPRPPVPQRVALLGRLGAGQQDIVEDAALAAGSWRVRQARLEHPG